MREHNQIEMDARRDAFLVSLATELRSRNHITTDDCRKVDGHLTHIRVDAQRQDHGFRQPMNGRLYVTFRLNYGSNGRAYTAQEGSKNGFNVKKAADAMEDQICQANREQQDERTRRQRRENSAAAVARVNQALGLKDYIGPRAEVDKFGWLKVELDELTEDEAMAVLKVIKEMRAK
jgi:hypothetical protein